MSRRNPFPPDAAPDDDVAEDEEGYGRPSRSALKRNAEALQRLGVHLTTLRPALLAKLPLPEELRDAIVEARRLRHGPALARQRQYIGRIMRSVDVVPIEAALERLK